MRVTFFYFSIVVLLLTAIISYYYHNFLWSLCISMPLILVGINDIIQPSQTIRRNYPVIGRMRYWAEWMRPKIYQYFIESDTDGAPFNRLNRNVI